MRKVRTMTVLVLICVLVTVALPGCQSKGKEFIGKWYSDQGKCLDVRENGTWKLDGFYGKGTWECVDDGTVEFTDFYGDVDEASLQEDEHGLYIHYDHRDFYKDGYPEMEQVAQEDQFRQQEAENPEEITNTEPTEPLTVEIDPFEGLSIEVTGVSPFCTLMVNTAACSTDAQMLVDYKTDATYYKNGDTATVTAELTVAATQGNYVLKETEMNFTVENQPQYITSAENVDLSPLDNEVQDLITAEAAKSLNTTWLFGGDWKTGVHLSIEKTTQNAVYLLSRKMQKHGADTEVHNSVIYVYTVTSRTDWECSFTLNVAVHAQNVIMYPDGSITWGGANMELTTKNEKNGFEAIVASQITSQTADYNITKIK